MDARSDRAVVPLAVDLDGTLIATDLLWEGLFLLLRRQPWALFLVPCWFLAGGPARLKLEIARRVDLDPASLPYREDLLKRLRRDRAAGRRLILATGTPRKFAEAIAAHLGLFDEVIATDGVHNLTSGRKADALRSRYGDAGFDYVGNSRHDLKVFDVARSSIVVAPDRQAAKWHKVNGGELLPAPRRTWRTFAKMLRVHQWLKNGLIAVPMVLAHEVFNPHMLVAFVLAFMSFSFAASAIYIINDFFDLALDRRHPTKRNRPLASGAIPMPVGMATVAVLLPASLLIALALPIEFMGVLLLYLATTTAYTFAIKRMLLIDVLVLAGLYTTRVLAGAAATGVDSSFWLLAFSTFFFLSLALVKRYVELRQSPMSAGEKLAGRGYCTEDQEIVAQAGMASAFSAALVLALYIDSDAVKLQYSHPWMVWPLAPIVLYMAMRVWILARRDQLHDDPVVFIISDWRSQLMAALGAVLLLLAVLVK